MNKKNHDIDFERFIIENSNNKLKKVNIIQFNILDYDIYLHCPRDSEYVTLYKKVPSFRDLSIWVYYIESFELLKINKGEVQIDNNMITVYKSENETFIIPENGGIIGPYIDKINKPIFEGNPNDCAFKRSENITRNDDGKPIRTKIRVSKNETIGLSLKIKEYCHTGWLK